jgi:hypothetical protein
MFRKDRNVTFPDLQQVQLPEMQQLQTSGGTKVRVQQKPGAELYQVQVTDYAEVYRVKSYSKKEVQSYGGFKFRGVLSTFLQQIERCTRCGVKQDLIIFSCIFFARAECEQGCRLSQFILCNILGRAEV